MDWYAYMNETLGNRDRKKIKNNTYAERLQDGIIGLRLHSTYVVLYFPDGTEELRSGGYETVTTQDRINNYSSARVYSDGKGWVLASAEPIEITPPKLQKCRTCHGTGNKVYQSYMGWDGIEVPEHKVECWKCKGTGTANYGSKKVLPRFHSGMRIRQGEPV